MCGTGCTALWVGESCSCLRNGRSREAGSYSLFAYRKDSDENVRRDRLPKTLVGDAVDWALAKGCNTVLVERHDGKPFHPSIVQHVCSDPACPGGC